MRVGISAHCHRRTIARSNRWPPWLAPAMHSNSSNPKQRTYSVGLVRQWAGRLGKLDNCQVAVFGVLTDGKLHTPRSTCAFTSPNAGSMILGNAIRPVSRKMYAH